MTLFAHGKMLTLDGVHTVCVSPTGTDTHVYTDAGAFHVEAKDEAALLRNLLCGVARGTFSYNGTSIEDTGGHLNFDRVETRKRK